MDDTKQTKLQMNLQMKCVQAGVFGTNCWIVWNAQTREGFVVDPGGDAERILAVIHAQKLKITHILLTHGHFDHIGAVKEVREETHALVCVAAEDAFRLETADRETLQNFFGRKAKAEAAVSPDLRLKNGDVLQIAGRNWTVTATPGHTEGSVCFDDGSWLFTGDTLFAYSCGRTDLNGGNPQKMRQSLAKLAKFAEIDGERLCFPGHENQFRLSDAKRYNPMLEDGEWGAE